MSPGLCHEDLLHLFGPIALRIHLSYCLPTHTNKMLQVNGPVYWVDYGDSPQPLPSKVKAQKQ